MTVDSKVTRPDAASMAASLPPVPPPSHAQALGSWHEGPAKDAIVRFVNDVTAPESPTFVPPEERIAVFDNDGTLWPEQPVPVQFAFALDRVKALATEHPEWREREPYRSILAGDVRTALDGGEKAIAEIIVASHSGMTTEAFASQVAAWLATARDPRFARPYPALAYRPMLELLAHLRHHGFRTYIVSGGGIDFLRVLSQQVYGIPPEQVIGSQGKVAFEVRDGRPVLVKLPELEVLDDKAGKPVGIHRHIGRRPVAAFGNSDGDLQMLQWTAAGTGARLAVIVHHTDAGREWQYERAPGIGELKDAMAEAKSRGWTVVDIRRDWKKVYAFE